MKFLDVDALYFTFIRKISSPPWRDLAIPDYTKINFDKEFNAGDAGFRQFSTNKAGPPPYKTSKWLYLRHFLYGCIYVSYFYGTLLIVIKAHLKTKNEHVRVSVGYKTLISYIYGSVNAVLLITARDCPGSIK